MAVDRSNNLLFLHIPKNAGKSIEVALQIITAKEAESYRFRNLTNRLATLIQRKTADADASSRLFGTLDYTLCSQHLTYAEIELLQLISSNELERMFKFVVCRNPFDRIVSTFAHFFPNVKLTPNSEHFCRFCQSWFDKTNANHNEIAHRRRQLDFIKSSNGSIVADEIVRFENLNEEYETKIRNRYRFAAELPSLGKRKRKLDYREVHSPETVAFTLSHFADDFDFFGYSTNIDAS